jgi:transposase-like protein
MVRGSESQRAKLDEIDVRIIKERLMTGETMASIAKDYGVSSTTIFYIKQGKHWKHVSI